ncbi:MAG: hypothetical protein B193_3794 [Solidesulfovibrio magneticus str. Maddingley MBC34]|uniref:Type II secretion system protein GspC N-terminal domain-containing protein n=1 Tax=Solidesulfovibrio magneticus str. Maddingley MBC34 TaxID=1206767 RepID=K6G8V4_9BACT|nr:MAG: hypothetical protein B193_3794 [Solidesulfovibrio magneticus str. Maddingley MBC34]
MTEYGIRRLAMGASALFLAGAALVVVTAWRFDAAPLAPPAPAASPKAPPPRPATAAPELTRAILANDVFGLTPLPDQRQQTKEPPKAAEIDMELTGTVIAADGRQAAAFLRDKGNKSQKVYAVGSTVKDARIKSIGKNFVILERQGREEILTMKP